MSADLNDGVYTVALTAGSEPALPSRILDYFVAQNILPLRFLSERNGDGLAVTITIDGVAEKKLTVIAQKLRQIPFVQDVDLRGGRS